METGSGSKAYTIIQVCLTPLLRLAFQGCNGGKKGKTDYIATTD